MLCSGLPDFLSAHTTVGKTDVFPTHVFPSHMVITVYGVLTCRAEDATGNPLTPSRGGPARRPLHVVGPTEDGVGVSRMRIAAASALAQLAQIWPPGTTLCSVSNSNRGGLGTTFTLWTGHPDIVTRLQCNVVLTLYICI
jgi:hypothetical protein